MAIRSLKTGALSRSALAGNPVIMPNSYESIASATGNGSSSIFTFSSIPSTYSHLQIRMISRGVRSLSAEQLYIRVNGDGGNNYTYHYLFADGSGVGVGANANVSVYFAAQFPAGTENANVYLSSVIDLLDYTSTNKHKVMKALNGYDNNANTGLLSSQVWFSSGVWMNSAAVTSISVLSNGAFASGTSIGLYGVN
ncbi:hypothetical protein UFOVP696_11 [uncultured Caudovirales phage]|uniref:Uncharacterized protein n=1 Tax=uncultured Caudovirales phage TaxID=2100421 RepID=A0A6J5MK05_9CAUD|nr:hypothetical protein UFOVP429_2 [uncultured Caudovirales phage]CAB4158115.1 hypothetical protein UFOVP696_11 [uncultured Caudovirales phage]